jgi:tetratricopeptide (TPR) repeat protein
VGRRWLLRIAAIALGLAPFVLFEFALVVLDLPKNTVHHDPFLDLGRIKPLFAESADGTLHIPEERQRLFAKVAFPRQKLTNAKRIFALGGSTTQGEPYGPPTAFPEWLRINLQQIDPEHTYEVVNCGGLSYASYRVLPILREVLEYDPDFILIYTGQNEFLEARELGGWRNIPDSVARVGSTAIQLRTVQWLRGFVTNESPENKGLPQTELQSEVDALLDYQGGLAKYHRSDLDRSSVNMSFRWNIEQMVMACRNQNIPVLVVVPTVNLKDSPPFKIEIDPQLSPALKEEVSKLWKEVEEHPGDPDRALQNATQILTIDPEHAGAHYLIGQQALAARDWEAAKKHLLLAKELDVCPLRSTNAIQQTVRDVCNHHKVPYIDADQVFQSKSPNQIVGREWLVDHIHPTIEGHQLLGEVICNKLLEIGWLKSNQSISVECRPEAYRQHLSTLGEDYFIRGKQRLEGLLLWTQGRAKKLPITPSPTNP